MGGGSIYQGRVEVCHSNVWGTVCDHSWSSNDGRVACRQLGFDYVSTNVYYGGGTGQIWLDDLICTGSERRLVDCFHRGYGTHNCVHYEDAGLHCRGKLYCSQK